MSLRALALVCALALAPACASLPIAQAPAATQAAEARAYAVLQSYPVLLETAARIVGDPAVPVDVKRALAAAERVATPAVEALAIAFDAYVRTRSDAAAHALNEATARAQAPIQALTSLLKRS
jgi:hypothetical protein